MNIQAMNNDLAQIDRIREQVRADPTALPTILAELAQTSPQLYNVKIVKIS